MVLKPTNWHANAEQPACWEIGKGPGEPWAYVPGEASRAPRAQESNQSSGIPLLGCVTLGGPSIPQALVFPSVK